MKNYRGWTTTTSSSTSSSSGSAICARWHRIFRSLSITAAAAAAAAAAACVFPSTNRIEWNRTVSRRFGGASVGRVGGLPHFFSIRKIKKRFHKETLWPHAVESILKSFFFRFFSFQTHSNLFPVLVTWLLDYRVLPSFTDCCLSRFNPSLSAVNVQFFLKGKQKTVAGPAGSFPCRCRGCTEELCIGFELPAVWAQPFSFNRLERRQGRRAWLGHVTLVT